MDASYNPRSSSNYDNPYLFTGRRVDILDSGSLKIQYNRNRYYDYYTGRWLTHDPLGYEDGMNLYEYVGSKPLMFVDPNGEAVVTVAVCGAVVTLTAAEAAAAAFGVSVATCMMIPDCRALIFDGTARAVADAVNAATKAVTGAARYVCRIRCRINHHGAHHSWIRPRWGIPPWKKCWMKHVQVLCYSKGTTGRLRTQIPYGPCYKFKYGAGGITH